MPDGVAPPTADPSRADLLKAGKTLLRRVKELEQEKRDLEAMLENATEHADHLAETLEQERNDLATLLEMTTEHADTVEDELHERAAEALIKSAQQMRMIVEATPAPVMISRVDDGQIVYANAMLGLLFEVPAEELLGKKTPDFYLDANDRVTLIASLKEEGSIDRHEVRFKKLDGEAIWVELSLRLLEFNDEPAILSAVYDITSRKEAALRLQQQVEELRLELEETSASSLLARSTGTTRFDNLDAVVVEQDSTRMVAIHSFRGGNGKSSITANVAGQLASSGLRVGVIDADIQSPGMHVLFGQAAAGIEHTLNDFLLGNCSVHQLAIDVSGALGVPVTGQVFLIPSSVNPGTMAQVLSQGYEAQRLTQCFHELSTLLNLDVLLVDTHPGLNEEALLTMRAVQTLVVVLRPDAQDFDGTGVTVQVARQLEVPRILLVVNQVPQTGQLQSVRRRVEQTFNSEVAAIVPQASEFMTFDGNGLFVLREPGHPISVALRHVASTMMAATMEAQPARAVEGG